MDGDALVLTQFENADGEKVKDLPIKSPWSASGTTMWTTQIDSMSLPWPSSVTYRHRPPKLNRSMRRPAGAVSGAAAPVRATSAI